MTEDDKKFEQELDFVASHYKHGPSPKQKHGANLPDRTRYGNGKGRLWPPLWLAS